MRRQGAGADAAAIRRGAAQGCQAADREPAPGLERRHRRCRSNARGRTACRRSASKAMSSSPPTACWPMPECHAGRIEIRGRQGVLHRRPRPRRPDRARPEFRRGPAELTAAQAGHPDPQRRRRSRPIRPIPRPRCGIRPARRSKPPARHAGVAPARSPSSAAPACSACSWTATTRSGCRWRRACGCPAASRASPACPSARRRKSSASHGLKAGEPQMLDPADDVSVTPWRRARSSDQLAP